MIKRIRAARHYQRADDPTIRLARKATMGVARELRHAFNNLGDLVPVGKVTDALQHGVDPKTLINWHHYVEVLRGPFTRLANLRHAGGQLGARKINGLFAAKRRKVRFRKEFNIQSEQKATKTEANYRRATNTMKDGESCGTCWMFQAPDSCYAVEGRILSTDVCDYWETIWVSKATGDQFNFDAFSPDVQQEIRDEQDRLIQQLESDARDAIDTIIRDGTIQGTDLEDVAAEIKDMIGLTDTQAQAVLNYQRMLYDLDPQSLARQLRNTDYDAILQDAIDSGTALSDTAIENMVDDYIENYLDYRAATIATTESTRAANIGLHDAYSQAIDRGALPEDAVTRQWQLGDSPCPICESIVDNNPDGVGVNDQFDSDDGPVDDPPVHPNCECSVEYVTDLTMVPDDTEAESEYEYQTQAT